MRNRLSSRPPSRRRSRRARADVESLDLWPTASRRPRGSRSTGTTSSSSHGRRSSKRPSLSSAGSWTGASGFAADRYIRAYPPVRPVSLRVRGELGRLSPRSSRHAPATPYCGRRPAGGAMSRALHAEDVPAMAPIRSRPCRPRTWDSFAPSGSSRPCRGSVVLADRQHLAPPTSPTPIPDAAVDPAAGSAALEIRRRGDTVALRGLTPRRSQFRRRARPWPDAEIAADAALAEDPAFDLATWPSGALLDEAPGRLHASYRSASGRESLDEHGDPQGHGGDPRPAWPAGLDRLARVPISLHQLCSAWASPACSCGPG